jgi:Kef-type K+ transport system membrane component KefB
VNILQGLNSLVAVALVAALTPLLVALLPGPKIPQVVIFLVGGVLIGPHVLGLADTGSIQLLSDIVLEFLFLPAGYELDPLLLRQRPGRLAITGWVMSAVISVGVTAGLTAAGYIKDYVPVGLALTTTALGTLLPILRDNDMLGGRIGRHIFAAGAVGELFPILIIAVFLTKRGHFIALASVVAVGVLAIILSTVPWLARSVAVQRVIREGQDATGQITLRWAVVLLFALLAFAARFGLDVVLGAMLAGIVLRIWTRRLNLDAENLERKFDTVGYGIFIPIFFVASGMTIDLKAISSDPLRVLVLLVLLLVVRGLPSLLIYRHDLEPRQRLEMTFITATSLPLLIALAEIGEQDGVMLPATAAALVGAGVLSVLIFPLIAVGLHKSGAKAPVQPDTLDEAPAA